MDLVGVMYWIYPLACIPAVYLFSREAAKPKLLLGILLAFIPWLVNAFSTGFNSAIATTVLVLGVVGSAFFKQAYRKYLLNDLSEELVLYYNYFPKNKDKRLEVEKKALQLIKKNKGKPKSKYALELLVNAYGSQVGDRKRILKELNGL